MKKHNEAAQKLFHSLLYYRKRNRLDESIMISYIMRTTTLPINLIYSNVCPISEIRVKLIIVKIINSCQSGQQERKMCCFSKTIANVRSKNVFIACICTSFSDVNTPTCTCIYIPSSVSHAISVHRRLT